MERQSEIERLQARIEELEKEVKALRSTQRGSPEWKARISERLKEVHAKRRANK